MKFKHLLPIFLVFVLCFGVCSFALADETAEVPEGYTPIYTAEDLYNIRNDLDGKYILMNDIDLSVYENWEPIGSSETPFTGELDGKGHFINCLKINQECSGAGDFYYGLFGYIKSVTENTIIKNIKLTDVDILINHNDSEKSKCYVGALCGYENLDFIYNCVVTGKICTVGFSTSEVGGLIGKSAWTTFYACSNYCDIQTICDSQATQAAVGGIVGTPKYTTIEESCNFGKIEIDDSGISDKCYIRVGGIEGNGADSVGIENCYNQGVISVESINSRTFIGGLSGEAANINNSYSIGVTSYPDNFKGYAGSIAGNLVMSVIPVEPGNKISNVYFTDEINLPSYNGMYPPDETSNNSFVNVKLLSEENFKNQASFVGFDFETIWEMEENGYPVLRNQPGVLLRKNIVLKVGEKYLIPHWDTDTLYDNSIISINTLGEVCAMNSGETKFTIEYKYNHKTEYLFTVISNEKPIEPTFPTICWFEELCVFRIVKSVVDTIVNWLNILVDMIVN